MAPEELPAALRYANLTGTLGELVERLRRLSAAGLRQQIHAAAGHIPATPPAASVADFV